MFLPDFKTEQWMTYHEQRAVYNLTDTCISPLSFKELLALDPDRNIGDIRLDYGTITGSARLKKAVLGLYQSGTENNLTMCCGCSQGNELVLNELLNPGDHVIAFMPGYEQFVRIPESLGCEVTVLPLYEEDRWQPHIEDLRNAWRDNTAMVLLNMPNNPTGTIFSDAFLAELVRLAEENHTYILCDEVYQDYTFPSLCDRYDKAIVTCSLSKTFALAGLRLGWIKAPEEIIARINRRRDYSLISTGNLTDTLAAIALEHRDRILERSRRIIRTGIHTAETWLQEEKRAHVQFPEAGAVCFMKYDIDVDSRTLCEELLDEYGVFFVPGWCFGRENHVRLGLTRSQEEMSAGLRLFSRYMDEKEGR